MATVIDQAANPGLYQTGKNENQVFDLSPSFQNVQFQERLQANKQAKQEAEKGAEEKKRYADIAGLKSIAILPADRQIFADKTKAMTDYVYQNAKALHEGDPKAIMGFQNIYADLATSAENSKNFREGLESRLAEVNKNEGAYEPEDVAKIKTAYNTPQTEGNYNLGQFGLNKVFNTDVKLRELGKQLEEQVAQGEQKYTDPQGRTFAHKKDESNEDFAKAVLIQKIHNDPEWQAKATREFNKLPQNEQQDLLKNATSPVDAIANSYTNQIFKQYPAEKNPLVFNKSTKVTDLAENKSNTGGGNGNSETKIKYEGDYTESPDGKTAVYDIRPINKGENPSTQIDDPNNPKAKITINPNKLNIDKNNLANSTLDATVVLTPKQVSANDTYKEEHPDPTVTGYKLPYPEKVNLDYTQAASIMKTNFGLPNIASLVDKETRNQVPGHISNKYTDVVKEEIKTLPSGVKVKKINGVWTPI